MNSGERQYELADYYVPYLAQPVELSPRQRAQLWWELLRTPLPAMTRMVIYRSLFTTRRRLVRKTS